MRMPAIACGVLLRLVPGLVAAAPALLRAQQEGVRVVAIAGTPFERGRQHGSELRAEIATLLGRWDAELQRQDGLGIDEFARRFLAATSYDEAARRWTPELLDEVRGIADGAGQSYERMLVWQLIDETWAQQGILREKCTSLGVDRRGDQSTIVAQNLDVPTWYHGSQTVLRIRDASRDLEQLVVTIPGLVAAAGMSSRRVAVAVNTLLQLRPCRDGLPVAFVVRGLLAQPDHAAALAFLQRIVHASGQNYVVGGPDTAPDFECSAGKCVPFRPWPDSAFVFHTNHPLRNDDVTAAWRTRATQRGFDPLGAACPRYDVCARAWPRGAEPDLAAVEKLLADRSGKPSVCNDSTYACLVMVLGSEPELRVTKGGSDAARFAVLRFTR